MIVVDASVLAPALADDGADGDRARERLADEVLTAPALIDLETASVFRGLVLSRKLPSRRATMALHDLDVLPLQRVDHRRLLTRCWELRDDLTLYDAAYVALAELLEVTLLTADRGLGVAPGHRCAVELLRA